MYFQSLGATFPKQKQNPASKRYMLSNAGYADFKIKLLKKSFAGVMSAKYLCFYRAITFIAGATPSA